MYLYARRLIGSYSAAHQASRMFDGLGNSQTAKQTYAAQPLIKPLGDADFWNIFADKDKVLVVSFWSDSCRPCDPVAEIMSTLAQSTSRRSFSSLVKFYQVQWDSKVNPHIRQRFGFKNIPVVYFYYTSTGLPPSRTAPLLEGSLGDDKWLFQHDQYEWRIRNILHRHGHIRVARIILIDLARSFASDTGMRNQYTSQLRSKFANLAPEWLKQQLITFRVEYRQTEPTTTEKNGFGPLDFPVYLLGSHHTDQFVEKLMREHGIPNRIDCPTVRQPDNPFELVKACWNRKADRGCGVPPGRGFRKVGFVKTHKISAERAGRNNPVRAFVNVTAHELGHMLNICTHTEQGLMKSPVPLGTNVDFSPGEKSVVLGDLVRLRDFR